MTDNSFANHPVSVLERRANKASDGSIWAPRDALVSALREIDQERFDPTDLIIIGRLSGKKSGEIRIFNSSEDGLIATGMMAKAMRHFSK